ncbi:gliding motility protein GldM [Pedobacter yulinensis]|uniref:Gliding motility protein GldM n=1 Tax=Pedobacter yulinensis TaxID=2126353 RepID=A0A2T3HNW8_9SPHI|nr:gliding motility protein GldM [Pedobacter yulinensis]PST84093.1 gliding motility protein GldM [Pedobacter yulinensis]
MAKSKMTPRQRLVNLMYLVLLAMLALSIPDSVLNAFKNLDDNLQESIQKNQFETSSYLASFRDKRLKGDPEKNTIILDRAGQAVSLVAGLNNYIDSLKGVLLDQTGGYRKETGEVANGENTDLTYQFFIKKENAAALRKRINETRSRLLALFPETERHTLNFKMSATDKKTASGQTESWEMYNFGKETPVTAAVTILSMLKSEAVNAENYLVKKILGHYDESVITLDRFVATASAPTAYVLAGQPYRADVYLNSYNSARAAQVTVNGQSIPVVNGIGKYESRSSRPGVYTWRGTVRMRQTDGTIKEFQTEPQTYQVAAPSATIAPEKLNIFYAGIGNPLRISAAGFSTDKLNVSLSGPGSLRRTQTGYSYQVGSEGIGKRVVLQTTTTVDGRSISLGSQEFRIKKLKDPTAKFAGKTAGTMNPVVLRNQDFIYANVEDFEFDVKYSIRRFTVTIVGPSRELSVIQNNGADFGQQLKAAFNSVRPGSKVIFDNILCTGPDGVDRVLNPIIMTIN